MKAANIPSFGPLQGVRVAHLCQSVAGPYCASRMADFGADVIWIENPKSMDVLRHSRWGAEQERRNMRSLCMDVFSPEGQNVFLDLLKTTDIVIDSFRGGQLANRGLSDDKMLEANPRLVIVHISGFGQTGVEEYVKRASYDQIAQAFGCYMQHNGLPGQKGMMVQPFVADYFTALQAAFVAISALFRARQTGIGESIDVAQYEVMMTLQGKPSSEYLNKGSVPVLQGYGSPVFVGQGLYTCKDGIDICCIFAGNGVIRGVMKVFGLEFNEIIPQGTYVFTSGSPAGELIEKTLNEYCASHTSDEVEEAFLGAGIPCSRVLNYKLAEENPHYQAREVFTEWENSKGEKVRGVNIFPKLRNYPGKIWRGLPTVGEDTSDILFELGYSEEKIAELQANGVAVKK